MTPPGLDLDVLPDALLVADPAGCVIDANAAARDLVGQALPGAPLPTFVDEAGRDWWDCERTARGMRSVRRVPERRLHVGTTQGPTVLLTGRYVRDASSDHRLTQVVLTLRDGAARDRLELDHAALISTVAHELRSPLTSVKGFSATMLAKWERFSDAQKRQMLEWINGDADRVTRLLSELLDVSRIDAGRLELHRQLVDVPAVVEQVFAGRIAAGESPSRFALADRGDLPETWLDPDKVAQVVANLVENALRHGAGQVRVTLGPHAGGVRLRVEDEGEGVRPDIAAQVFTKFFRGKSRRGGTGLGLYIVKGLVEAHGGTIELRSAPGGGACFQVDLPAGAPAFAR